MYSIAIPQFWKSRSVRRFAYNKKKLCTRSVKVVRTEQPERIMVDFGQSCTAADDGSLMIRIVSAEDKRDGYEAACR